MTVHLPATRSPDRGRFLRVVVWFAILLGALVLAQLMLAYLGSSTLVEF